MDFLWRKRNCSCWTAPIEPEEWSAIAQRVYERRKAYDGIVIIHGTDTLAYTASALSFALQQIEIPVVLTGSQVSIENPIADATENCRAALHMAASHCPGVYVAFNRKIMLGVRASKVRTRSFDALRALIIRMRRGSTVATVVDPEMKKHKGGECVLRERFCTDVLLKLFPGISPNIFKIAGDGRAWHLYRSIWYRWTAVERRNLTEVIGKAVADKG